MRVFELAKQCGISSKELLNILAKLKVRVSSHMASLQEETARKVRESIKPTKPSERPLAKPAPKPKGKPIAKKVTPSAPTAPSPAAAPTSAPPVAARRAKPAPVPPSVPVAPPTEAAAPAAPAAAKPPPAPPTPAARPPPAAMPSQPSAAPPQPSAAPSPPAAASVPAAAGVPAAAPKRLAIRAPLTVKELAEKLSVSPSDVIKRLLGMKILATINQLLSEETVKTLLPLYGCELERMPTAEEQLEAVHLEEDRAKLLPRPAVVTFMGHVDHGKTSLLDAIRQSKVAEREAGGITQHIGAYRVTLPKGSITFLDTPGHEAFTAMRARGAHVTDVVVLVVAADDGVMPQTVEAIDHSRAAEATIVVALNKIDLPAAQPDRVKKQLMELGLAPEEWGGKTIVVPVSAKTGQGIDQLLEMILLEAELLELKADPAKPAKGIVLEAELSKGGGPVAHVLVQSGALRLGDVVVSGPFGGRVRAMLDERGHRLKEAGPSTPVEVLGLDGVPKAGDSFLVVPDERQAREVILRRKEELRAAKPILRRAISLEEFHRQLEVGRVKSLNLILKADMQGSLEALKGSLDKLSTEEANVKFLHVGIGDVTEPDVLLAEASDAVVIGFHVGLTPEAEVLAKQEQVDVRLYQIIYEASRDIWAALEGLLEPHRVETVIGRAKVLQLFKVSKVGVIAGSQVVKGKIVRGSLARVWRGQEKVFEGKVTSLKRFKDDVREVAEGLQCGIGVSNFGDFQPEDIIEAIEVSQVAAKL